MRSGDPAPGPDYVIDTRDVNPQGAVDKPSDIPTASGEVNGQTPKPQYGLSSFEVF